MKAKLTALAMGVVLLGAAGAVSAQNGPVSPTPVGGVGVAPQALPPLPAAAGGAEVNFDELVKNTLGLTPNQIKELRKQMDVRQKAASELPRTPPKPVTTMINASTAPGSVPPVVRLFTGYATSLMITDSTGQPWPIENFTVGQKDLFEVKRLDPSKENGTIPGSALSIVPMNTYGTSNMIVYLRGLSAPIAISFVSGQKEVDFRVDLRVQGRGPNAQLAAAGLPASTNNALLSVLEGVAPSDAKVLRVSSPEAQAWLTKEGSVYLRTSLQVISPAWVGSMRSADGMSAYELRPASSILVLRDGAIQQLSIDGL